MKNCIILGLLLFFTQQNLLAQHTINGVVLDKNTHKVISFASVDLTNGHGTLTNSEGKFRLILPENSGKDSLIFSAMGYQRKAVALKDYKNGKVLLISGAELQMVTVYSHELTADEIMQHVKENLIKNYDFSHVSFTVFRRNKSAMIPKQMHYHLKRADVIPKRTIQRFNKAIDSLNRANKNQHATFYNAYLARVVKNGKELKARVEKATQLIHKDSDNSMEDIVNKVIQTLAKSIQSSHTFKARTGIIPIGDSIDLSKNFKVEEDKDQIDSIHSSSVASSMKRVLKDALFYAEKDRRFNISLGTDLDGEFISNYITELDDYEYTLIGKSVLNDQKVYVISYKPDRGFLTRGGRYTGMLYIAADSFAVLKATFKLAKGRHGNKLNLKFLLGFKYVEQEKAGTIIFKKNDQDTYFPQYIGLSGKKYLYVKRGLVFKENDANRSDRMKLKLKFTVAVENQYHTQWVFTDVKPCYTNNYNAFIPNSGAVIEELSKYNPQVWQAYNILAPTQAIKNYK